MRVKTISNLLGCIAAASLLFSGNAARAGTATWDFQTDPTVGANPLRIYQTGNFVNSWGEPMYWLPQGGNPGGFLGITWPIGNSSTIAVFPDIDDGKIVTSFRFQCDLRVGNPQQNERAADGFSINFARSNDPVLVNDPPSQADFATSGAVETGTRTGIAISFDTWAGNALPDAADIEGIIVRVDNRTILRHSVPTRNGACENATSLQTGTRDVPYWDAERVNLPDSAYVPDAWRTLCWQPLVVELDDQARLTVIWKGVTVLNQFQTDYFPSAGGLVLAGRTGGADQHTHFDNIVLTTTAIVEDTTPPTTPGVPQVVQAGAYRVALAWDPSTDDSGRVAYEIEQNGELLPGQFVAATADIRGLSPSTSYTFRVRATDVSGNRSDWVSVQATTVADVADPNYAAIQIYGTPANPIPGASTLDLQNMVVFDDRFPNNPDRVERLNGMVMSFGEPTFGDTFGDNIGFRIAGTVTPTVTGQYRFFIRSDDASQLYLNQAGPALPEVDLGSYIAEETGCCAAFLEPNPSLPAWRGQTSDPIQLTAGQSYGIVFVVKEGGGGDWGQVAWRREGDTTPAASLPPIGRGNFQSAIVPRSDPVGAVVNITQPPQSLTTQANQPVTFTVTAETASPYTTAVIYQWMRNGTPIPGATGPTYSIPLVAQADAGDYSVLIAVPGASQTSAAATLTVTADVTPPTITSVEASRRFTDLTVNFSEPVTAPTATTAANYTISGGVTVTAAQQLNPTTVRLTTSRMADDTAYTLTVNNVQDTAANPIAPNTTAQFRSWVFTLGRALWDYWGGLPGVTLQPLRDDPRYPDNPDQTQIREAFEAPIDFADNFAGRVSGWVIPPTTGSYVFFLSADDNAELFLSTDADPANRQLIATEPEWNAARDWTNIARRPQGQNRSDQFPGTQWPTGNTINLTAGQRYYAEILYSEGGGGDNAAITWKLAGEPDPAPGSPALSGNVIGAYLPPTPVTGPEFTSAALVGGNLVIAWSTGVLESAETITGPWTVVPDATSPATIPTTGTQRFYRLR
jgi:hypothetical protein